MKKREQIDKERTKTDITVNQKFLGLLVAKWNNKVIVI